MSEIPDEAGESVGVAVNYEPDDFGIKVTSELGDATIVVHHSWEGAEDAATLVQALPNILLAVQAALEEQETSPSD